MSNLFKFLIVSALILATNNVFAEEQKNSDLIKTRALLVPDSETIISSQLAGKIIELKSKIGTNFTRNEVIAKFDCAELYAKLQVAEAELEAANVTLKAKQELQKLKSAGEIEVALAAAAVAKSKAQTNLQKVLIDSCEIKAPFSGSVVKTLAHPFQSVNQGQQLLEIVSDNPPSVRMHIPSKWLQWLKTTSVFKVFIDETGKNYEGIVKRISSKIDPASQTVEIEGELSLSQPLVAGMSGYATFKRKSSK